MSAPRMANPTTASLARRNKGWLLLRTAVALAAIGAITSVFVAHRSSINSATVGFCYLIAILIFATVWGFTESAAASIAAMLCFNFYFMPPTGTFTVSDPQNLVALVTFLATALTASRLSARLKYRTKEALDRQREIERLYSLSRSILLTVTAEPPAKEIARQIASMFDSPAVALYDRGADETFLAGPEALSGIDTQLRETAARPGVRRGDGTFLASIHLGGEPIGALAVQGTNLSDAALQSLLNLVAVGLERARAQESINRAEIARQSEELKSTLLDAIAHEFKTPLTSVKAVTTDLLSDSADPLSEQQRGLLTIADEEADRMARLVSEAIQLARIEGGEFQLRREVHFPSSLLAAAIRQTKPLTAGRELTVQAADDLPLVVADAGLIQMVIAHLIDNAVKYSPPGSPIGVGARPGEEGVILYVADQGTGVAETDQARIFDKFYRAGKGDSFHETGMGLAIAREIVHAHGKEIAVRSAPGKGSEFYFALPIAPAGSME
jgi:two-component system sensor histidine kinase KdpD